ncbi:MAG TPA: universal stress protein [Xanthobacteraceae bacterium]|jgi:nucleotide-binding universal stress UspA family protein|nr:universal stress protein [Xanthobacteraceae bacterium]
MIKDIVVNLGLSKGGGPAGDYAVSIASALNAHLAGVAFVYDPIVPVSATGYIPAEIIEQQQANNETDAKAAITRFAAATGRAGLSAEPLSITASLAGAGEQFGRIARRFDLSIVGQADPESGSIEDIIAETTLFESGRPMIVVPYIQKGPLKLDKVMVCWDGSRQAARAIGDAMPLLTKAGRVEVTIIANEPGKQDEIEGVDMGQHLARHGLKIDVQRIPGGDIHVADALLSHAADSSADFMVMGGYGHSRLREFVLGGVTRSIFRSMTIPALMSH